LNNTRLRDYYRIPIVWMIFIILIGFVIGAGSIDTEGVRRGSVGLGDSGKLLRALSVAFIFVFSFFKVIQSNAFKFVLHGTNMYLFIYFLLCVASAVFSPVKSITLFKALEIFTVILMLATAYRSEDMYELSKKYIVALLVFYTITVIGVYVQFAIFGSAGQRQLVGVTPLFGFMLISKYPGMVGNALGFLGATVAIFGVYVSSTINNKNKQRTFLGIIIFLAGAGVTFFSYTRSVMFFLYIAIFLYFFLRKKVVMNMAMVLMLILPLTLPQVQDKIVDHLRRGASDDEISSLSGRTEMWSNVFDRRIIKLIIGEGYATGSKYMNFNKSGTTLVQGNVHNGFLEVVMSIGLLGGFIWLAMLVRLSVQFYQYHKVARFRSLVTERNFHFFMMALLFLSLSRSVMNSTFVYLDYFEPLLMAFILYGDSLRKKARDLYSEVEPATHSHEEMLEKKNVELGGSPRLPILVRKKV